MNSLSELTMLSEKLSDLCGERESLINLKRELEERNTATTNALMIARNQGAFPFPLLLRAQKIQTEKSVLLSKFAENSNKQSALYKQMSEAYSGLYPASPSEGSSI